MDYTRLTTCPVLVVGITYEPPLKPECVLNTTDLSADEAADKVILYMQDRGYIG